MVIPPFRVRIAKTEAFVECANISFVLGHFTLLILVFQFSDAFLQLELVDDPLLLQGEQDGLLIFQ